MRIWFPRRAAEISTAEPAPASDVARRSRWADILHVFVLVNFALAQPVYDRLRERSAFLIDMDLGWSAMCTLVVLLTAVLPSVIVLLEWLVSCVSRRAYNALHLTIVLALLILLALPFVKLITFLPGSLVICAALIGAIAGTWSYSSSRHIRSVVTLASPGMLVFPGTFLLNSWFNMATVLPPSTKSEKWQPAPVVMLVFDEFCGSSLMTPEREIDAHRFPNFAELARHSTWFRNATAVNPQTEFAVPAILSGQFSERFTFATPASRPQNLFNVLKNTGGYDSAAFEPVSRLASERSNELPNRASGTWTQTRFLGSILWRVYLYHVTPTDLIRNLPTVPVAWFGVNWNHQVDTRRTRGVFRYFWGDRRDAQFRHFLNCIDGSSPSTLHFMHLLQPHVPWCYLPSGKRYLEDGQDWQLLDLTTHGNGGDHWGSDELEVTQSQQRYLLQLMYIDRLIGQLISRLKETGQYDKCLLIVTADHGISFRVDEPRRAVSAGTIDEILSIPLFIKRPGQVQGQISDRTVESVDLLPSIADVLGITLHGKLDGWSVFDTRRPARQEIRYSDIRGNWVVDQKVITHSKSPQVLRRRFGDSSDPEAMYRLGPVPELIGVQPGTLKQSAAGPLELDLFRYSDEVNENALIQVPCLYEGTIQSNIALADSPVILAVAVNGTIRATTRTYQQAGYLSQWAVMVPESAYRDGKNDVQFFRVTGNAPDWELTRCTVHYRPREASATPPMNLIP